MRESDINVKKYVDDGERGSKNLEKRALRIFESMAVAKVSGERSFTKFNRISGLFFMRAL